MTNASRPLRLPSCVWKSILKAKDILRKNIKWHLGDGRNVNVWLDWWYGDGHLIDKFPGNHGDNGMKFSQLITQNGTWDLGPINHIIDQTTSDGISNMPLHLINISPDYLLGWELPMANSMCLRPTNP